LRLKGLSLVERKCSKLNNELTKNTRVVRQRQFRMIDLENDSGLGTKVYSSHPVIPHTRSPTLKSGCPDATTLHTPKFTKACRICTRVGEHRTVRSLVGKEVNGREVDLSRVHRLNRVQRTPICSLE
jgi:hypothetical protein